MGTIKYRNGADLTELEDIKKRWQEYRVEIYKKKNKHVSIKFTKAKHSKMRYGNKRH